MVKNGSWKRTASNIRTCVRYTFRHENIEISINSSRCVRFFAQMSDFECYEEQSLVTFLVVMNSNLL
jgi:hypothetical protein